MAVSTSCCLNLLPSPPPPGSNPSIPSKTSQVSMRRNERSWRNQCVLGMACVIIGLDMGNLTSNESRAIAEDLQLVVESNKNVVRWSDKRTCPPWQMNSLETIVPENLPRPSAHRRWEGVAYSKIAPAVKIIVKTSTNCFSM